MTAIDQRIDDWKLTDSESLSIPDPLRSLSIVSACMDIGKADMKEASQGYGWSSFNLPGSRCRFRFHLQSDHVFYVECGPVGKETKRVLCKEASEGDLEVRIWSKEPSRHGKDQTEIEIEWTSVPILDSPRLAWNQDRVLARNVTTLMEHLGELTDAQKRLFLKYV